ncbi:MAG: TetR/AcrR family transcriptional regulator [Clostridia bacterium]|nr:TetR/AcrR family transcriptional regulator [Clostridia bacterium]
MEKFESLDQEKRERILNAALSEFAARGYEQASTNEIVKQAEISKGLLFHYFKNKKQLFLYVYDYYVGICLEDYFKRMNREERDFFKIIRESVAIKLELLKKHPGIFKFISEAYLEKAPGIKEEIEKRNLKLVEYSFAKILKNIDESRFIEGMDAIKAINIISWTVEGYVNEEFKKARYLDIPVDYDKLFIQAESYLDLFERTLYKGGQTT